MSLSALIDPVYSLLSYLPVTLKDSSTPVVAPSAPEMAFVVRLAGLSGAVAVSMGAYGAHVMRDNPDIEYNRKMAFETGSRYHLIHSVALLATSKSRYPMLTFAALASGILLFCGPCYHYALTGDATTRKITPVGGMLLIFSWISFVL